jgi:hypothetical protein
MLSRTMTILGWPTFPRGRAATSLQLSRKPMRNAYPKMSQEKRGPAGIG